MVNWLLIIITVLGTIVLVILVSTIWYFKYCKATCKVRHFPPYSEQNITPLYQVLTSCKYWMDGKINILSLKLISTKQLLCRPSQEENPLVQYNKQAKKAKIRSVTPENIQECLKVMGLDLFKYN